MVAGMRLTDATGRFRVGAAIKEALLNAIYRGNLEISFKQMQDTRVSLLEGKGEDLLPSGARPSRLTSDRKVHVSMSTSTPEQARFVDSRRGPGLRSRRSSGRRPAGLARSGDRPRPGADAGVPGRGDV